MIRLKPAAAALVLLAAASPACATGKPKDLLPLDRGVFVRADDPCERPNNANSEAYRGDAFATTSTVCKIRDLKAQGRDYTYTAHCTQALFPRIVDKLRISLTIPDRRTFVVNHPADRDGKTQTTYRWCSRHYDED